MNFIIEIRCDNILKGNLIVIIYLTSFLKVISKVIFIFFFNWLIIFIFYTSFNTFSKSTHYITQTMSMFLEYR